MMLDRRLTKLDGSLLSAAGHLDRERTAAEDSSSAEMLATLVAGIWRSNEEGASSSFGAERFYFLVAEFQVPLRKM